MDKTNQKNKMGSPYLKERKEAVKKARMLAYEIAKMDDAFMGVLETFDTYDSEGTGFPWQFNIFDLDEPNAPEIGELDDVIDQAREQYKALLEGAYVVGFTAAICRIRIENTLTHDTREGSNWLDTHFCYK